MSHIITCIFCEKESSPTNEHVVPEFLGGSLVIKELCKECNSKMGSDFEGPISQSIIFRLPRDLYDIQGKSSSSINAFPNTGSTEDGTKVKVDSQFKPYMMTKVEEKKIEGGVEVNLSVDLSDKDKIPQIIEAKIRRTAKNEWPDMSKEEVNALVKNALVSLPTEYIIKKFQPTIKYRESVDFNHVSLLMMKIAYEISFYHHGAKVLLNKTNSKLRQAIHERDTKAEILGQLCPNPDPFSYITWSENCHSLVLCKGMCYLRLFNFSAIIQIYDEKSEFSLNEEDWVVYWFNFVDKSWGKESFLHYISNTLKQPKR